MKILLCKYCSKVNRSKFSDFCSASCQMNYRYHTEKDFCERRKKSTRKRYQKLKNNPIFKKKRYNNLKRWLGVPENRERFNRQMNELTKVRNKIIYKLRKKKHLCTICGDKLPNREFYNCLSCRIKKRKIEEGRRERNRRIKNGI